VGSLAGKKSRQPRNPIADCRQWQQPEGTRQSQGYLTYAQVNESLPLAIVHPEKIEEIVEELKRSGIRIVPG
jgi:hypothetical protein